MSDIALKILREFGLPTLLAVGLGALLAYTMQQSAEERASHTALLIDQISDLREKQERCCR
jgi:hypothetical protein